MSTPIKSYKDLIVWQKAVDLCVKVYKLTETFPKSEVFGITSQIRRSVVSVASNIAEGNGRNKNGNEYKQFLYIARGSLQELETQLIIAQKLELIVDNSLLEQCNALFLEVEKMLNVILSKLK